MPSREDSKWDKGQFEGKKQISDKDKEAIVEYYRAGRNAGMPREELLEDLAKLYNRSDRQIQRYISEGGTEISLRPEPQKSAKHTRMETVTIQPSRKEFPDEQSYVGAKYLNISIPSNDLWIDSVTITTSHPKSQYKFLIFDRKQPPDFYNEEDIFWDQEGSGHKATYVEPKPQIYHDADACKHLHCGLVHEGHPRRFDIEEQELEDYFREPVTYTVTVEYQLSQ